MITYRRGPEILTRGPAHELEDTSTGRRWAVSANELTEWSDRVDHIIVGETECASLDFLLQFRSVSDVWIQTPHIRDLTGLLTLTSLRKLAIDRPKCRMDLLGDLQTLEDLYIDAWRPGAESLFRLKGLRRLGIQRYPYEDLGPMKELTALRDLWLNAGKLCSLDGVPPTLEKLRISSNKRLDSLVPLRGCLRLEDLWMQSVRQLQSLEGLEPCPLRILSLVKIGALRTLEPLRGKPELEFIAIMESDVNHLDVNALYSLPSVKTLRISRRSGLDANRVRTSSPAVEVSLSEY